MSSARLSESALYRFVPLAIVAGDEITADFGVLGTIGCAISPT